MQHSTNQPALVLISQESLEQDVISRNGVQKNVHAVIKNQPFKMTLGMTNATSEINLRKYNIEAALVYDNEQQKAVHYVKNAPLEYETSNVSDKGDRVIIAMKLIVLSSQHEDMFFRVKFSLTAGKNIMTLLSEPIKVVSKPAQLKMNKTIAKRGRKRTANDRIVEALARIEEQQNQHQAMLASLFKTVSTPSPVSAPSTPSSCLTDDEEIESSRPVKRARVEPILEKKDMEVDTAADQFEAHLKGLIRAFAQLPNSDRAMIVRRIVKDVPAESTEKLSEMMDCLWSEGMQKPVGANVETGSPYAPLVGVETPEDLDIFYQELLSQSVAPQETSRLDSKNSKAAQASSTNGNQKSR